MWMESGSKSVPVEIWNRIKKRGPDMTRVCPQHRFISTNDLRGYVDWFQRVPWQLFCTLTFAWSVSDRQAVKVFSGFINRLEYYLSCPIGYLRGDEKRFSGCGMPGAPRHFHALLAAEVPLNPKPIGDVWMDMAGRGENGAGAHILPYDPNLGGLAYCLKFINQPGGDWDLGNLDLFLPMNREQMNRRRRRRQARHEMRLSSKGAK
jgi:hypothetical protein